MIKLLLNNYSDHEVKELISILEKASDKLCIICHSEFRCGMCKVRHFCDDIDRALTTATRLLEKRMEETS